MNTHVIQWGMNYGNKRPKYSFTSYELTNDDSFLMSYTVHPYLLLLKVEYIFSTL